MIRFLFRRAAQGAFVLWAAFTASFVLLFLLPSDPVLTMLGADGQGANVDPVEVAALRTEYGFDQPVWLQYLSRLGAALRGDFGHSMSTGAPVTTEIAAALPATGLLALIAVCLAVVIAAGIAIAATSTSHGWLRRFLLSLPPLGVAIPTFWLALVLLQIFSFRLGLLPAFGAEGWTSLVLPAITLALPVSASMAQVFASSLDATWGSPFVQTARAKGARRPRLLTRHVLRNALSPALTVAGVTLGAVLAGSVVTESVYGRPGLGRLAEQAVAAQDIPVVQGIVVLAAAIFVIANLGVDVLQARIDPRLLSGGAR